MKREYEEAFAEVDEILQLMSADLLLKIPLQFKKVISENKAQDYIPKFKEHIEEEQLKYETKVILGKIYRDFLVTPEEREELLSKEAEMLKKIEQEMQEQYDMQNIFEKRKARANQQYEQYTTDLTVYKKPSFLKKFFNLIRGIFNKK